jgi:hypothetical protein
VVNQSIKESINVLNEKLIEIKTDIEIKQNLVEKNTQNDSAYNNIINEYNNLVTTYNTLGKELEGMVTTYNNQARAFDGCVRAR